MGWGEVTCVSEMRGWKAVGQPWVRAQRDHSCWRWGQRAVSGPRPGPPPGSTWACVSGTRAGSAPPSRWGPGWRWGARGAPRREGGAGARAGPGRAGLESERGGGGWEMPALPQPRVWSLGNPSPRMAERTPGPGPGQRVGFDVSRVPAPVQGRRPGSLGSAKPAHPGQGQPRPPRPGTCFLFQNTPWDRAALPACLCLSA